MLFLFAAPPTHYGFFGMNTIRAIAEAKFGKVGVARTTTLESLYEAFQNRDGDAFVVQVQFHDPRVAQLLRRTKTKVVIFDNPLIDTFCFGMRNENSKFHIALRLATLSISTQLLISDVASVVRYDWPGSDARLLSLIQSLSLFFGIEPDEELVQKAAKYLKVPAMTQRTTVEEALAAGFPQRIDNEAVFSRLSDQQRFVVAYLDKAYGDLVASDAKKTISWPPQALTSTTDGEMLQSPISLLGPARRFTSGPNLHLPVGEWLLEVVIGIDDNQSGNRLVIDVTDSRKSRAKQEIDLPSRGRLAVTIRFTVEDTTKPVAIDMTTLEGAIEGMLSVESLRLRRINSWNAEIAGDS